MNNKEQSRNEKNAALAVQHGYEKARWDHTARTIMSHGINNFWAETNAVIIPIGDKDQQLGYSLDKPDEYYSITLADIPVESAEKILGNTIPRMQSDATPTIADDKPYMMGDNGFTRIRGNAGQIVEAFNTLLDAKNIRPTSNLKAFSR